MLVVEHRQQTAGQIARLLGFEADLQVVGQASSTVDALELIDSGEVEVVVLGRLDEERGLDAAARMLEATPNLQIILLTVAPTTELMRLAMKGGLADVVQTPLDSKSLYDAVRHAGEKYRRLKVQTGQLIPVPEPVQLGPRGTIVAVHSGKGGAGCTTLATNLALKLHSDTKPAVLVDADLSHGDAPLFLNLQPRHTVADLLPIQERADVELIEQVLLRHESGLQLLAAPNPLEDIDISPSEFVSVLDSLRARYGWVVVDTGELIVDPALAVLQEADFILTVLTPEITSIRRLRVFFEVLSVIGIPEDRVALVLNMTEKNGITAGQIEQNLGRIIEVEIGYDRKAVLDSINRGEPLALNTKTRPFTKGLLELVAKVRELAVAANEQDQESESI